MIAYQTNLNGYYIGPVNCDPDPLVPNNWLVPGGATLTAPAPPVGKVAKFVNGDWVYENPAPDNPDYVPLTPEQELTLARSKMICSPAQMRLTLLNAGLLSVVQAIADSDPQASIVWQYATQIYRNSPFIANLLDNPIQSFTPEQVDALFIAAMGLDI